MEEQEQQNGWLVWGRREVFPLVASLEVFPLVATLYHLVASIFRDSQARDSQASVGENGSLEVFQTQVFPLVYLDSQVAVSSAAPAATATAMANTTMLEVQTESECGQCSICLDNYTVGTIVRQLPCEHKFHDACVSEWIKKPSSSRNCPVCRYQL